MADPIRVMQRGSADVINSRTELARMILVVVTGLCLVWLVPAGLLGSGAVRSAAEAFENQAHTETIPSSHPEAASAATAHSAAKEIAKQRVLADFLSKRYRVSREALFDFVNLAYAAGQVTKIDPLLILAVIAVESSFNPIAESVAGAKGLMQVIPHYHPEKFRPRQGGEIDVLDPETNILAGAKVLREYAARSGNDLVAALRLYAGVASNPTSPYPGRVLSERERLEQVVRQLQQRATAGAQPSGPEHKRAQSI